MSMCWINCVAQRPAGLNAFDFHGYVSHWVWLMFPQLVGMPSWATCCVNVTPTMPCKQLLLRRTPSVKTALPFNVFPGCQAVHMFQTNLHSRLWRSFHLPNTDTSSSPLTESRDSNLDCILHKKLGQQLHSGGAWGKSSCLHLQWWPAIFLLLSLEALVQYLLDTGFMTSARDAIAPAIARQVQLTTANHKIAWCEKMDFAHVCVCVFFFRFGWMYSWWVYACKQGHYVYDGVSKKAPERVGGDLEIPLRFGFSTSYCWWLKFCTTWDVWNPINNGILYISTGWPDFFHQQ